MNFTFFNPKQDYLNTRYYTDLYFSYARANREPNRNDFESDPNAQPDKSILN
jgi:iron complex outermembrane receptor protein